MTSQQDRRITVIVTVLIIAVPLVYSRSVLDSGLLPKLVVLSVGACLAALVWLDVEKAGRMPEVRTLTDLPIVIYLLLVILQWPRSFDVHHSAIEVAKLVALFTIYTAVSRYSVKEDWRTWSTVLGAVGTVVSTIGILQYWGLGFLDLPSAGLPSATFPYRNTAATFCIAVLPFVLVKFVAANSFRCELLWAICSVAIIVFLLYTRTRGAWIGGLICCGLLGTLAIYRVPHGSRFQILLSRAMSKAPVGMAAIILIGIVGHAEMSPKATDHTLPAAIPEAKQTVGSAITSIVSGPDGSMARPNPSGRTGFWAATAEMLGDFPLFGVGLGNWEKYYPLYRAKGGWENRFPRRPHNDYLWIWAETGLLGICAYLGIAASAVVLAARSTESSDDSTFYEVLPAIAGYIAIQTHGLFSFPRERIGSMFVGWLCLSVVAAGGRTATTRAETLTKFGRPAMACVLCLLGSTLIFRAALSEASTAAGIVWSQNGRHAEAVRMVERATRLGVPDYRHLLAHAAVYVGGGRNDDAYAASQEAVRRHPNSINGFRNLGSVARSLGKLDESVIAYERAVALRPYRHDLYSELAGAYELNGEPLEAVEAYKRAGQHGADEAWVAYHSGQVYLRSGLVVSARRAYAKAIELQPGFARAHFGAGNAAILLEQNAEAMAHYRAGLEIEPTSPEAHFTIGMLYASEGRKHKALAHLEEAVRFASDEELRSEAERYLESAKQSDQGH